MNETDEQTIITTTRPLRRRLPPPAPIEAQEAAARLLLGVAGQPVTPDARRLVLTDSVTRFWTFCAAIGRVRAAYRTLGGKG